MKSSRNEVLSSPDADYEIEYDPIDQEKSRRQESDRRARSQQNEVKSKRGSVLARRNAKKGDYEIKESQAIKSPEITKIKQNEVKSKRDSVLARRITTSKDYETRDMKTATKQQRSSEMKSRFHPTATIRKTTEGNAQTTTVKEKSTRSDRLRQIISHQKVTTRESSYACANFKKQEFQHTLEGMRPPIQGN
ncbi:uncharacterized protein F5147DRAFT_661789 [Suillus discolor]|uniref:Uncharacterized protein n=1 Tax=Suillus discolor TaxID=1912936 RepID=A0A9P7ER66_9AGAM|nr:uncharacterized protein F5147DRAFT_661789 [Suillus discolor]KAG2079586.1 hypothetical protein F5147DRAFT_661789 [Suillus discolor]